MIKLPIHVHSIKQMVNINCLLFFRIVSTHVNKLILTNYVF